MLIRFVSGKNSCAVCAKGEGWLKGVLKNPSLWLQWPTVCKWSKLVVLCSIPTQCHVYGHVHVAEC